MLTRIEYNVLFTINKLNELSEMNKNYSNDFILVSQTCRKISKYKQFEINDALINLSKNDYIFDIFSNDSIRLENASLTDHGRTELKNYYSDIIRSILKKYIPVIITSMITSIITLYITTHFA